jgi:glycosyltransferase involved in cell wall biosynthesis
MSVSISVITVCRNAEATIEQTIQGVISQTYPQIQYIVIDGASSDRTLDIIKRYTDYIDTLISEPDEGVYQAMNKGIRLATGDWLYFANADDYLFGPEAIADVAAFINGHPDCDFVYGDHETRFPWGKRSTYSPVPPEEALEQLISLGNCFIQPASFFKAELFDRLGYFNERYRIAADYEWFCQMLSTPGVNISYLPRIIVSYFQGGLSSDIPSLFEEVFAIQNSLPIYQQPEWLEKRMKSLQASFIDKYDSLQKSNRLSRKRLQQVEHLSPVAARVPGLVQRIQELTELTADYESQISTLKTRIAAMESSKFWQLRERWFTLKQKLGLPTDEE